MNIFLLIGIVGMALILWAFLMNQLNRWKNSDLIYDLVNFLGSVCLVVYAIPTRMWPFIILNSIWAISSGIDVIKDFRQKNRGLVGPMSNSTL